MLGGVAEVVFSADSEIGPRCGIVLSELAPDLELALDLGTGPRLYISVEVTDSAVLGGVAEVVSSNPRWAIKIFFSIFRHS